MAKRDPLEFRGSDFPLDVGWVDAYGGAVGLVFKRYEELRGPVWDEFANAVEGVEADETLSPLGKERALKKLAEKYSEHPVVRGMAADLSKLRERCAKLREELLAPPKDDGRHKLDAYAALELWDREKRKIDKLEALDSLERRSQLAQAASRHDHELLRIALRRDLIDDERLRELCEVELMHEHPSFLEYQHLGGRLMPGTSTFNPTTGVLHCANQLLETYRTHVDTACGLKAGQSEMEALVKAGVRDDGVTITKGAMDRYGLPIYEHANAIAKAKGVKFRIVNDDDVPPGMQIAPGGSAANGAPRDGQEGK